MKFPESVLLGKKGCLSQSGGKCNFLVILEDDPDLLSL